MQLTFPGRQKCGFSGRWKGKGYEEQMRMVRKDRSAIKEKKIKGRWEDRHLGRGLVMWSCAAHQPSSHCGRDREIQLLVTAPHSRSSPRSYALMAQVSASGSWSKVKTGPTCFTTIYLPSTSTHHRAESILPGSLLMWNRGLSQL